MLYPEFERNFIRLKKSQVHNVKLCDKSDACFLIHIQFQSEIDFVYSSDKIYPNNLILTEL